MPDQFGNPTPQEVLAQIGGENNSVIAGAQTPAARRNAMLYALGRNMTVSQDPRMAQAKAISNALGRSMALERNDGESALDFELRKGRAMYDDLKDVDRPSAQQVGERLLQLEQERDEQDKLRSREERERQQEARNVEMHNLQTAQMRSAAAVRNFEGIRYGYDYKNNKLVDGLWTHIDDPTSVVDEKEWSAKGIIPISPEMAFQLRLATDKTNQDILGSDFRAKTDVLTSYVDSAIMAREIAKGFRESLEAGFNPTASIRGLTSRLQSIANSVEVVREAAHTRDGLLDPNFRAAPKPGSREFAEDERRVTDALNRAGMKTAIPSSLLTLYVYGVAKAQDARVTNMDYETIAGTLSAAVGNPEQTAEVIESQLGIRKESLARTVVEQAKRLAASSDPNAREQGETLLALASQGDEVFSQFLSEKEQLFNFGKRAAPFRTPSGESIDPTGFTVEDTAAGE